MVQFDAGSGSAQSDHIENTLLGLAIDLIDFLRVDVCFLCFCLNSLDSIGVQWFFSLTALKVLEIIIFCFLFMSIINLSDLKINKKKLIKYNIIKTIKLKKFIENL